jgi:hypothetical protein
VQAFSRNAKDCWKSVAGALLGGLTAQVGQAFGANPESLLAGLAIWVGSGIAATVAGHYINRIQTDLQGKENERLAAKNHLLKLAAAGSLRVALESFSSPQLEGWPEVWRLQLEKATEDETYLDKLFPTESVRDALEAANPEQEAGSLALLDLLKSWRGLAIDNAEGLDFGPLNSFVANSPPISTELENRIKTGLLQSYRTQFITLLTNPDEDMLFRAFVEKKLDKIDATTVRTEKMVAELLKQWQRPMPLGKVKAAMLPPATPFFTGRKEFLLTVHESLQQKRAALIHAGGGFGKTQFALEYVKQFGGNYQDVLWIRAENPVRSSDGK